MKNFFKKHFVSILFIGFLFVFSFTLNVFATAWPYAPGVTLNPGCDPIIDDNCTVTIVGGSDTQVQYNDGGDFAGSANFVWNKTTNNLKAGDLTNTKIGTNAGIAITTGAKNVIIGDEAGTLATDSKEMVLIGYGAGHSKSQYDQDVMIGYNAGYNTTTGDTNIFIGGNAGYSNTTGANNKFIGNAAGYFNTSGNQLTFFGDAAGYNNTTGSDNTFLGATSGYENTTGYENTGVGRESLYYNVTGYDNIAIGNQAGYNLLGNTNVAIGVRSGYNSIGGGNIFIGNQAGMNETGSNKLFIDNQDRGSEANDRIKSLIYGTFDADPANQVLTVNGKIKITQGVPGAGKVLTSDADGLATWETPAGGASILQETFVDLSAAQIQTANSILINTGISVGAGEAIEVISASMNFTANTIPFTSQQLNLIIDTASTPQKSCVGSGLLSGVDYFTVCGTAGDGDQFRDNVDLFIQADADSLVGDGTARIYISYRIITL
ncbi:MAG: hypothetical protein WC264_03810 [Candidatus Paceibacterota bacterium]